MERCPGGLVNEVLEHEIKSGHAKSEHENPF